MMKMNTALCGLALLGGSTTQAFVPPTDNMLNTLSFPLIGQSSDPALSNSVKAQKLLESLKARYEKLQTLSVTIEHHNSSGLFPGEFTQSLKWKGKDCFSLNVIKRGNSSAPDFSSDGSTVTEKSKDGGVKTYPVSKSQNVSTPYGVSGGLIMSWLLKDPSVQMLLSPPAGMKIEYSLNEKSKWQGQDVKSLGLKMVIGAQSMNITLYVSQDGQHLLGMQGDEKMKMGYMKYEGEKSQ